MTEGEFIDAIACRFPYEDDGAAVAVIAAACTLGPNAAFAVANELARPPQSLSPSVGIRINLLAELRRNLRHPLADPVLAIAERMIRGEQVSVAEAVDMMMLIAGHPGSYKALSLVYFSCDDHEGDADRLYNEIVKRWQAV